MSAVVVAPGVRTTPFETLCQQLRDPAEIHSLLTVSGWDRMFMPPAGRDSRSELTAGWDAQAHRALYDPELRAALEHVLERAEECQPWQVTFAQFVLDSIKHSSCLPESFITERSKKAAKVYSAYDAARSRNDFGLFCKDLAVAVDLERREGEFLQTVYHGLTPADALLQTYAKGMTWKQYGQLVAPMWNWLEQTQAVVGWTSESQAIPLGESAQFELSRQITLRTGLNPRRATVTQHLRSLATILGPDDARMTVRVIPDNALMTWLGASHEVGHIKEMLNRRSMLLQRQPPLLVQDKSVIETFPLLHENYLFPSRPMIEWLHQQLGWYAPFNTMSLQELWLAFNGISFSTRKLATRRPILIMHNVIAAEIERLLLAEGSDRLAAEDVFEWYAAKMTKLSGTRPSDTVLHENLLATNTWANGCIGIQTAYPLGLMFAADIHEAAMAIPEVAQSFEQGQYGPYDTWLAETTRDAWMMSGQELTRAVAKKEPSADAWIRSMDRLLAATRALR